MVAGGASSALIHAAFSVSLNADQIVSGTAINFLGLGATGYLFIKIYGDQGTPSDLPAIPGCTFRSAGSRSWARRSNSSTS